LATEDNWEVGDGSSTTVLDTIDEEDNDSVTMENDDSGTTRLNYQGQVVVAKEEEVVSLQMTRAEYEAWLKHLDQIITKDLKDEEVANAKHETRR